MPRLFPLLLAIALVLPIIAHSAPPVCVVQAPGTPLQATVTGTVPTTDSETPPQPLPSGTVLTYNLYRATASGAEGSAAYKSGLTSPTYVDTAVTAGQTYYYTMTAVDTGGESLQSNEGCKTFPAVAPAPPNPLSVK